MPTRRVGRPRASPENPDTRTRILETTEALLGSTGFAGTSMEEVSAATGITKGTLYHYFPSKDALVTAMLHRVLDRESAITQAALGGAQSARAQLEAMAAVSLSRQQHTQRIMMMVSDAKRFLPEALWQELFARFMQESYAPLEHIMRHGIETGEFAEHDPSFSAWAFMGLLSQLSDPEMTRGKGDAVQELVNFVIHGIGSQGRSGKSKVESRK